MWKRIAMLGVGLLFMSAAMSPLQVAASSVVGQVPVKVLVQQLPESDIVDLVNGSLPAVNKARVEVLEAGVSRATNHNGETLVSLNPGTYTFRVSVDGVPFTTSVKRTISEQGLKEFAIHFNTQRNVEIDDATLARYQPRQANPPGPAVAGSRKSVDGDVTIQAIPIEPTLPKTVDVYSPAQDKLYTYAIEDYVKKVLAKEIGLGLYKPYLTDAQELTMFEAKAIVTRTYGTYHSKFGACAPANRFGAKLDDTTWCQVVDHGFTGTSTDNINKAVSNTYHKIAIKVTDFQNGLFDYIDSVFFASDNGQTKSSLQEWGNYYSYLQSETDAYDEDVSTWICDNKPGVGYCPSPRVGGYAGHGVGFSQDGNAGYAKNGYTATWIVTHFYRGTSIYLAYE